mgnify:FL=1
MSPERSVYPVDPTVEAMKSFSISLFCFLLFFVYQFSTQAKAQTIAPPAITKVDAKPTTVGVYTLLDAVLGRYVASVQVMSLSLLLGGMIYRVTDIYVFNTNGNTRAQSEEYDKRLGENIQLREDLASLSGENENLEYQVNLLSGILKKRHPERDEEYAVAAKSNKARHSDELTVDQGDSTLIA